MSGSNDDTDGNRRRYGNATVVEAVQRLRDGGLVAVPTETVYGLAADSTNAAAVAEIYRTKGRPDFNPLIVHVSDLEAAEKLGHFNHLAKKMVDCFWPGPLTLVVQKAENCPAAPAVTAGLDTIALRSPAHPIMRELLAESGLSLAAPSANKSGSISPTSAKHVEHSLGENAPMILDGGPCDQGLESTIVAVRGEGYQILRPGPVTADALQACTGKPVSDGGNSKIEAPGQLASHYAPSKPLRLNAETAEPTEYHLGFGAIAGDKNLTERGDLVEAAENLFAFLHIADASERAGIAIAPIPQQDIGTAINDRLLRASRGLQYNKLHHNIL